MNHNNNSDIKEIIFSNSNSNSTSKSSNSTSKSKINNNNEENQSIFFPESNNEKNILNFITDNKQNVNIDINIAVQDIVYKDDLVYIAELENQLLSEYPVTSQSLKYVQEKVKQNALRIIEVKNIGLQNNEINQQHIEYHLMYDIMNSQFHKCDWIYPIVYDKHKIFIQLQEDTY